jgi:hypothetical protein
MFDHIPNLIERNRNLARELERQMSGARIAKCRLADSRDAGDALRQRCAQVRAASINITAALPSPTNA